jgi:hypothetical protein
MIKNFFRGIDARPLALFRIVIALILIKDALYHLVLAHPFYDDTGLLPRVALLDGLARTHRFSLMDALPHEWMVVLFFLCWIIVLIALLVGYRTRLATVLNFVILLSIHERNTYILTGADTALRVFSFWMMFVPVGARYSIDALRHRQPGTIPFLPVWLLRGQFILIYVSSVYLKLNGEMWVQGDALKSILQLDSLLLLPGVWLSHIPEFILSLLTYNVLLIEGLVPVCLILPVWQPLLRGIGILAGSLLHIGIGLTLAIPDFSLVMLAGYLLFVDPVWIEPVEKRVRRWAARLHPRLPGIFHTRADSEKTAPDHTGNRLIRAGVMFGLCLLMGLVIWWNINKSFDYTDDTFPPMPNPAYHLVEYTGLWQYWDLFAPLPLQIDGHLAIPGQFENGITFDLHNPDAAIGQAVPVRFGPAMRWRKLAENLFFYEPPRLLQSMGAYFCRTYNAQAIPGTYLLSLEIQYRYQQVQMAAQEQPDTITEVLWSHECSLPN